MSKNKLILFFLIANILLFPFLEISARIFLSVKEQSLDFIAYGFKDTGKGKYTIITGQDGKMLYAKGLPSKNRLNPVNSLGFRGHEINEKKTTTTRIVCLGGSTTYGSGLDHCDTYPKLLQDMLDKKFGEGRFEVINTGMPAFSLSNIIILVKKEIIYLHPDIVILMNLNNNFEVPGINFVGFDFGQKAGRFYKLKRFVVTHLALGFIVNEAVNSIIGSPEARYYKHWDWQAYSRALMSPDNIWQAKFEQNLDQLMEVLFKSNPSVKVILVEEACNFTDYPAMQAPFEKAKEILRKSVRLNKNIHTVSIQEAIVDAAQKGEQVWQEPWWDPLHLSRQGNEIIADILTKDLSGTLTNAQPVMP